MPLLLAWRLRALAFQRDVLALVLATLDRRVPLAPKLITAALFLYALSPADLLPDLLPPLGIADDLGVAALGIATARRLVPAPIFEEHRAAAARRLRSLRLGFMVFAAAVASWVVVLIAAAWLVLR